MRGDKKASIASMLIEKNLITREQLDSAIQQQKLTGKKIGQILVESGHIDEVSLLKILAEQLNISYINLKNYQLEPELVKLLPEFHARNFRAIVLKREGDKLLVGMVDPYDLLAVEEVERMLKQRIKLALIREEDLLQVIDNFYRRSEDISYFAGTLSAELKPNELNIFAEKQDFSTEDMPVVNLLRSIFEDAAQVNASDVHIEPGENILRIRLRVDGVLQEQIIQEKSIATALVQRIKIASGLNIAENRLPQDGRFSMKVKNRNFDVRVSTLPVQYGESLVMRLLNQSAELLELNQVGMPQSILDRYSQILSASYGLMLIVGPTGGGKTTTLYASLNRLNKAEDKIITVEDPVEYRLPRINQVQVNAKIGLTFAGILRSILRQDPDIIMIGEIRDEETMEIALRAAMTGHFVLGTLHTNDTISSATRLLDMGAKGYLVASVLRGILAQRLVRRLCEKCVQEDPLTIEEKNWLQSICEGKYVNHSFKKGNGCVYCHNTGYQGRIGIFELLSITPEIIDALRSSDIGDFTAKALKQPLYKPLVETGLDLAVTGGTSIEEIIRMAGEI